MTQSMASPAISFVSQLPFVTRSFVAASFLLALATGGVVIHVAGIPPPAVGTVGENGPATEAALNNAEDVAVAPDGDIYIADFNSRRLLRIRDGILTVAYRGGQGENDFSGVAIAPDGTVYFTTGWALMSLASDGGSVREVLPSDPGDQVFTPKMAVAADGTVYLSGGRLPRIDRVDRDGTATLVAGADEAATEPGVGDGGSGARRPFLPHHRAGDRLPRGPLCL